MLLNSSTAQISFVKFRQGCAGDIEHCGDVEAVVRNKSTSGSNMHNLQIDGVQCCEASTPKPLATSCQQLTIACAISCATATMGHLTHHHMPPRDTHNQGPVACTAPDNLISNANPTYAFKTLHYATLKIRLQQLGAATNHMHAFLNRALKPTLDKSQQTDQEPPRFFCSLNNGSTGACITCAPNVSPNAVLRLQSACSLRNRTFSAETLSDGISA